jgi:hemolysin III
MAEAAVATARPKPILRGVSHQLACLVTPLGVAWLVRRAPNETAALAAAVYGSALAALFAVSALYHRPYWSAAARARMRRADHAMIYVLIGATATPCGLLGVRGDLGRWLLLAMWAAAVLGMVKEFVWLKSPRLVTAGIYAVVSWVGLVAAPKLLAAVGGRDLAIFLGGGGLYTVGAIVYALKRPDPWPKWFGHHEIFHLLVIVAAACHFFVVGHLVARG